ncbi:hypothetical protein M0805_002918 [Coniferiporia weirii]|nr:hypothetical protein M0805_002918 [Coniferiporia weirii]
MASSPPHHSAKNKSPEHEDDTDAQASGSATRPPAKRARKAINCAPCRTSKLKCDKARPCSSCVLRGTASHCYTDGKDEGSSRRHGIDPHNEIARMRQSLATLEAYVIRGARASDSVSSAKDRRASSAREPGGNNGNGGGGLKREPDGDADALAVPGMLAEKGRGGFYAGPTSTATLLFSLRAAGDARDGSDDVERSGGSSDASEDDAPTDVARGFDDDLLAQLPAIHVIDGLVDYYQNFCNWMYRHVHIGAFSAAWARFKDSASADRLVLATLSVVMAVAVRYLPERHALLSALPHGTREEIGERFYHVACEALARYRAESRALSLELVELLLIRTHYLTLSKNESEEIWSIRGELVSIGTAMGLHRDPTKWRMSRELAERRRWAWWHIVLLERWQCFLFGRPLSVGSHHFDTRMPSYVDPAIDKTGRLFLPNIYMFKLADILGDIVDDAVSIRPVPYSRVLERDKELVAWMEDLPRELDLDEYRLARSLASPIPADMRLGVLSVIIRTSYHHIRFTLHRPYAATAHDRASSPSSSQKTPSSTSTKGSSAGGNANDPGPEHHARMAQSLDTAASAADKLIQLVAQARPDVLGNASLAVPAHVHWGPFHCFSAAMFFSLQLVADPNQPGASLFRTNIRRVLDILSLSHGVPIADKASDMLLALRPLYDAEPGADGAERERTKEQVIALVKGLAFPYHDSFASAAGSAGATRSHHDSPRSSGGAASPTNARRGSSTAASSPSATLGMPMLSPTLPRNAHGALTPGPAPPYSRAAPSLQGGVGASVQPRSGASAGAMSYFPAGQGQGQGGPMRPAPTPTFSSGGMPSMGLGAPAPGGVGYTAQGDDVAMWGASVGFGQGEWARFLDVMQRTEASGLMNGS